MPWNDLVIWKYDDPGKAAAARLAIMKALRGGDILEGVLLKEQPKVRANAKKHRGFTLHHASVTWDLQKLVSKQIGESTPKEAGEKMLAMMKKILGEGKEIWFGSDGMVYIQVSGADWANARHKLDQYLERSKTLASQREFQETRKHLPAQATVLHFIEMSAYGQIMADFMQGLAQKSEKLPPLDTHKTGYFGAAITFEPGSGKLDVWLPAAGIRAFFLPVELLLRVMEMREFPEPPEPPQPPKKEKQPKSDQKTFQGTWKVVDAISAGEKVSNVDKMNLSFVFEGNAWKSHELGKVPKAAARGTFRLDPSKKPKAIDLYIIGEKGTQRGIYNLQGDKLTLCLPDRARKERTPDFASTKENNCSIWFLERKK